MNGNIREEINHKKNSLDIVRGNRINLSKRMKIKDDFWNVIFFLNNFIAILFFVTSIYLMDNHLGFWSGIYSIYVIILQYTINSFNYKGLHVLAKNNELSIEKKIMKLKNLYRSDLSDENLEREFEIIYSEYLTELEFYPNHSNIDLTQNFFENEKSKKEQKESEKEKTKVSAIYEIKKNFIKSRNYVLEWLFEIINILVIVIACIMFFINYVL